jgi:hypothetical protein
VHAHHQRGRIIGPIIDSPDSYAIDPLTNIESIPRRKNAGAPSCSVHYTLYELLQRIFSTYLISSSQRQNFLLSSRKFSSFEFQ